MNFINLYGKWIIFLFFIIIVLCRCFCVGFKECFCLFDGDSDGMVLESELGLIMRFLGENIIYNEIIVFMKKVGTFFSRFEY